MLGFSAEVIEEGDDAGTWVIRPRIIEADAKPAIDLTAIAANGLKPEIGDIVFCVETRNNYDHDDQQRINNPMGAYLVIVGTFAEIVNFSGEVVLGAGTYKMVLGEKLGAWAAKVDASINALYNYLQSVQAPPGALGGPLVPVFPGTPTPGAWVNADNLSQRNKLD